ncbi:MAG: efflux RND transporter periplasmic adaptor subunit [Chlamydiota bacterium]|nr:efflux RND transporter periplasmic adaptor subunit [Chlamydiota bacterium]
MRLALSLIIACNFTSLSAQYEDEYLNFDVSEEYEEFPEEMYQVVIDPLHRTQLSAEIQSPVTQINKYMGENFKAGESLIQLDDVVYQSNLKKAQAILDRANVELEAKKQLFNDNVASLFELKEAEANVAVAQADLSIAKRDLDATVVDAPYDGKVVSLNIEEHELTQAGEEIIEIIYDKVLLARLLIPASKLKEIKVGQTFNIEILEANKNFNAVIKRIGSVIDPSSATIRIEAEIDNSDGSLRAGMTGRALFDVEQPKAPKLKEDVSKPKKIHQTKVEKDTPNNYAIPSTPQPYAEEAIDQDQMEMNNDEADVPLIDKLDYQDDMDPLDTFFDEDHVEPTSDDFSSGQEEQNIPQPTNEVRSESKKPKGWHFFE